MTPLKRKIIKNFQTSKLWASRCKVGKPADPTKTKPFFASVPVFLGRLNFGVCIFFWEAKSVQKGFPRDPITLSDDDWGV